MIKILRPLGASCAAIVAPPIPEPMIMTSASCTYFILISLCGSNATALSILMTKSNISPVVTSASARMREMQSFPASSMVTKVSAPAGSVTPTRFEMGTTVFDLRSTPSGSVGSPLVECQVRYPYLPNRTYFLD